jgi:hypothetical protein
MEVRVPNSPQATRVRLTSIISASTNKDHHTALQSVEHEMELSTKDVVSQRSEWIPLVDWFAGITGACVIAALLWAAIAIT